jgi:threonine aldolase
MANAEVGDEQRGEDPSTNRLCEMTKELLGKEAAVFMPSGTMCNQIAILVQCNPGDDIIADKSAHIINSEGGGPAVFAGAMIRPVDGVRGVFQPDQADPQGPPPCPAQPHDRHRTDRECRRRHGLAAGHHPRRQ